MVDYKGIADRAVEIIGTADPSQYVTAYDAMILETTTSPVTTELRIKEGEILSGLGLTAGSAFIDKLQANTHASAMRLLQGEGINVTDSESKTVMSNLLAGSLITQDEYDWVATHYIRTVETWPGLKPGHVQNALEYRNGGLI